MARRRRRPARGGPAVTTLVRELAALLSELDLAEVEVAMGDVRVRLQRHGVAAPPSPAALAAFAAPPAPAAVAPVVAEVEPAAEVLLEAAPANVDVVALVEELRSVDGLDEVHDVHVWTLTSGFVALAGHGVIDDPARHTRILEEIQELVRAHGIGHVTFQLEMRPLYRLPPPRADQSGQPC